MKNRQKRIERAKNASLVAIEKRTYSCKTSYRPPPRLSAQSHSTAKSYLKNQTSSFSNHFIQKINKHIEFAGEFIKAKYELKQITEKYPIPEDVYYVTKMLKSVVYGKRNLKPFFNHFLQNLKSFKFLKKQCPPPLEELEGKFVVMPKLGKKKTLILDLDETLIHCEYKEEADSKDQKIVVDINLDNDQKAKVSPISLSTNFYQFFLLKIFQIGLDLHSPLRQELHREHEQDLRGGHIHGKPPILR